MITDASFGQQASLGDTLPGYQRLFNVFTLRERSTYQFRSTGDGIHLPSDPRPR